MWLNVEQESDFDLGLYDIITFLRQNDIITWFLEILSWNEIV